MISEPYLAWEVPLREHVVGSMVGLHRRWTIEAATFTVQARTPAEAKAAAIRAAHIRAAVAPYKPYLRQSVPFVGTPVRAALSALQEKQAKVRKRGRTT